jgi:hypothetical protein
MAVVLIAHDRGRVQPNRGLRSSILKNEFSVAMQEYARQARDGQLTATDIRLRAERKAGQFLKDMAEKGERGAGKGGNRKSRFREGIVKLNDLNVSKKQMVAMTIEAE